jgi:hypothetical protein
MSLPDKCLDTAVKSAQRQCGSGGLTRAAGCGELRMRKIIQANIARFKSLLETESDPTKRAMESRLLAEEEVKLKELAEAEKIKADRS